MDINRKLVGFKWSALFGTEHGLGEKWLFFQEDFTFSDYKKKPCLLEEVENTRLLKISFKCLPTIEK